MLMTRNIKLAIASIRSARWRSFLTMLGIIIGVASVVVTVSIGEGIKKQVQSQINRSGPDLITVQPGNSVTRDKDGNVVSVNVFASVASGAFNEVDWKSIRDTKGVAKAVPFNIVSGVPRYQDTTMPSGIIIGTTEQLPEVLHQDMEYGNFFAADDKNKQVVVIGKRVAEQLFQELAPIGKDVQIRGKQFVVRGVFKEFPAGSMVTNTDYNTAIFMPYDVSKEISANQVQIYQVLTKAENVEQVDATASNIRERLKSKHGGEEDFTVLKQDENLQVVGTMLNLLTAFIAGIAAISLLVGGIGIMNIMLVLVSERTREIGVRKAVGATNRQIMMQFLVESAMISLMGGFFGVLLSLLANYFIRIFTDLQPVITLPIMFISTGIALLVGVIFGTMPAVRAARKDPIECLRYE